MSGSLVCSYKASLLKGKVMPSVGQYILAVIYRVRFGSRIQLITGLQLNGSLVRKTIGWPFRSSFLPICFSS